MKGANADPSVNMIKKLNNIKNRIIGPSHHFFLTFKNCQNSKSIESLLIFLSYPLTLPSVNPEINQRLKIKNSITTGRLTIIAPAE